MLEFDFLEAADGTPLTKTFTLTDTGAYDVNPYPHVRLFNSYRFTASNIEQLYDHMCDQAAQQRCLLKGNLRDQLTNAARLGMTEPTLPTSWLCLDLDFDDGWTSIEEFVLAVDPALADISYIFQHSASAGITSKHGLRGHVFFLLDRPILPSLLKMWLRSRNLTIQSLRDRMSLAANGLSLKWPLDITTCQNDKLIYIAAPECQGFVDPISTARIELVLKKHTSAPYLSTFTEHTPATLDRVATEVLNELRFHAGLDKAKPKYKQTRGVEYLSNPEQVIITGVRHARGFIYLNLNAGNSWAYYMPDDNPEFVHNFKGEPIVRLRDIAPDFYHELRNAQIRETRANREFLPLVFRDRDRDTYYNALYHEGNRTVEYARVSNVQKLNHFLLQYGEVPPEVIEDWSVEFNPTIVDVIDLKTKWLNTYQPSPYILNTEAVEAPRVPKQIKRVIDSICGNDSATFEHFMNWLAYIFQTRNKSGTAWVFHGVSGTGKGLLLSKILKPLFGPAHVIEYTAQQVEDQFNAGLEHSCIVCIDEFHHESARSSGTIMNKLKNLVTEDSIAIRAMRTDTVMTRSYVNVLIFSNHPDPVRLSTHDRRFNVAPAQEHQLRMSAKEIDRIDSELEDFAAYLKSYQVDEERTRLVLLNDARTRMISASQTSVERMFEAFRTGDLAYFLDYVSIKMPMQDTLMYNEFTTVCASWAQAARDQKMCGVPLTDIRTVYSYIIGTPTSPAKLRRILAIHRLMFERSIQGISVHWAIEPERLDAFFVQRAELTQPTRLKVANA